MQNRYVRKERTQWRDLELSQRHRKWGWDCPAVDIDLLLLEYDNGKPAAIVEYKHETASLGSLQHPSYMALKNLGDCAKIPVLIVKYSGDFKRWECTPLNDYARFFLPSSVILTEADYVAMLYKIRNRNVNTTVQKSILSAWERSDEPPDSIKETDEEAETAFWLSF